jgi:transposase
MDFSCTERIVQMPEFRVISQKTPHGEVVLEQERQVPCLRCPRCSSFCTSVSEVRMRCVKDLPMSGREVRHVIRLRRFYCSNCGHRPWEACETLPRYKRAYGRLSATARESVLRNVPSKEVGRLLGVPARTVFRWAFERRRAGRPRSLGRVLGIDEFSRRKGHVYCTHVVDLERRRTIAVLPGRGKDVLVEWLRSRPAHELARVETVVIDMSKTYEPAVREVFGLRVLVIDRFHVMHQAVDALGKVHIALKRQLGKGEARKFDQMRRLWLRSTSDGRLSAEQAMERLQWLWRFPQLQAAVLWIQDLRAWYARRYVSPARRALSELIDRARKLDLEPFADVAGTLERWAEPITAFVGRRYTNGPTEGFNTKIKLIQRTAYGLRNEQNRALRIRAACGVR